MQGVLRIFVWPGLRAFVRDLRAGELTLLLLALLVAVTAVSSVGFLSDRTSRALDARSAQMHGGDLLVRSDRPLPQAVVQYARQLALETSLSVSMSSMVSTGKAMQLVSLKAVDQAYPLRGELEVESWKTGAATAAKPAPGRAPAAGTVWVDPRLPALLDLDETGILQVGDTRLQVQHIIVHEPDRTVQFANLAPRVLMALDDLPQTGLVGPGSRLRYTLAVAGEPQQVMQFQAWLEPQLVRGQSIQLPGSGSPEVQRSLKRAHQFLVLVSLLTVVVASIAVALAARHFNRRHQSGFALMRCLGASHAQSVALLLTEFLLLALSVAVIGSALAFLVQFALVEIVSGWLGVSLPAASWRPLAYGFGTALLLLAGFAYPPLAGLRHSPPAAVLRQQAVVGVRRRVLPYVPGVAVFFLFTVWMSGDWQLGLLVFSGFALSVCAFALLGWGLVALAGLVRQQADGHSSLRFALAGLARRRALTIVQLSSLATGLLVLLLLGIVRTDLLRGWEATVPEFAPNTFLINIQPEQTDAVKGFLEQAAIAFPGLLPMARARLVTVNGKVLRSDDYANERAKGLVEREFNLSYLPDLPESNRLERGRWLDQERNEVSLETGLANTLGLVLGDQLGFEVAGQEVVVEVTSLREVKWDSFDVNFFAILSAQALKSAPLSYITSFYLAPTQQAVAQELVGQFPNLTVFDLGALLAQVRSILSQAIQAVQLLFLFTLLAAVLVLMAAFMSTREERAHEIAVLRILGARNRQLRFNLRIEFLLVGALAGLMASGAAWGIASLLARHVFEFPLAFAWWPWPAGLVAGVVSAWVAGRIALRGVLSAPPLFTLREVG